MRDAYRDISVERLRTSIAGRDENEYLLVDVRQPDEYARGHIPGSILIPLGEIQGRINELPTDRDVVVYCRSGKRSRAAAIFISSQPYIAGTVFNMTGGILAWDGHLLPATPNVKVFEVTGGDQEVLLRAMNLERGADRWYRAVREQHPTLSWTEDLAALAVAEEGHARLMYQHWAAGETAPPPFAQVYAALPGDIVEGGFTCASLLRIMESQPPDPCRSILEMALTIEYSAYDLSRTMAHRFQGQPLETIFNAVAESEKKHMQLVAQALALCAG